MRWADGANLTLTRRSSAPSLGGLFNGALGFKAREVVVSVQGIFYVAAHVSDLARSKSFYSDKLGWKLETNEPTVAGFRFGAGYLVLSSDSTHPATHALTGGMHVAVQVTDIDAEYSKLIKSGVEVTELRTQPWGERNFSFRDPDGYEWSYGEVKQGA
jgi:uncharacterized glyoxalase superfamily protein PhnB